MKRGQILEGVVERVDYPGKGMVPAGEREFAVKNVLPGQKIRFSAKKLKKGNSEGRLVEILEPSGKEIAADCPHFAYCGGCVYRTLPYPEELRMKEDQIFRLLKSVCPDPHFEGILPAPQETEYRNKMEFSFGDAQKNGPLTLGMHRRGSFYDIETVDHCRIVDQDCRQILSGVLSFMQEQKVPYYHRGTHEGYLRHLLVRKAKKTGQILVNLITSTQMDTVREEKLLAGFTKTLTELPLSGILTGVLHTRNDRIADVIENEGTDLLWGQDWFYEELLGLRFKITPFSFFQTNSAGAEVLYQTARTYMGDVTGKTVFDLYSGTGTIAQILSPVAENVIGVEIVEEAVEAARENAALNGLTNCRFIAGDVLKVIDELEEKPDLLMLDPPRDGIHPKALQKILRYNVPRIVYISCKATSLVRDLEVFQENGYEVKKSICIDMFPRTVHVETVVLMSRIQD